MVARNEIFWADYGPPGGRRPVCILTRNTAIDLLTSVTVAPLTRRIRDLPTEVRLGRDDGVPEDCVISCDNLGTILLSKLDPEPIAALTLPKRAELNRALRYALDVVY